MAKITFEDKNYFAGQPFNQLKDSEVNEIKASVNALYDGAGAYAVVTELPAIIATGLQLLYNGTMWRGLLEGESSLAAGTPWPVKGYKEFSLFAEVNLNSDTVTREVVNCNDIKLLYEFSEPPSDIILKNFPFTSNYQINWNTWNSVGDFIANTAITVFQDDLFFTGIQSGSSMFQSITIKEYPPAP
jgi:hypothetical protein